MSQIVKYNSRIVQKHDTKANWDAIPEFVPMAGEIIIYDADEIDNYTRFKIGDGITPLISLSFQDTILYTEQSLTSAQQLQARTNIGAISMADVETYVNEAILGGEW